MSSPEDAPLPGPSDLDAGLRAAFRGRGAARESVLREIERQTGAEAPLIALKESPDGDSGSPVMKAGAAVKGLVPQGRANYQLQGEIARGGMGVIVKGHDQDLGRTVALKILREDLSRRPEIVQRFVEEAQIGGQLQHPGIVPVYELGLMADQRPYFSMKLVKGRTLAALLADHPADRGGERRKLLDVFESVCQTIAYAHSKGVVHRDLKPANILIGAFGEVQVVDWGLAKLLKTGGVHDERRSQAARASNVSVIETVRSRPGSSGSESLSGSVLGTPAYMPPEQARGDVEKLDERSDVFSLGAILCEILTGAPPYVGDAETTLDQAANGRLDDALRRIDGCKADPELNELAKQCLVPAQAARPRSAEVLAERVHAYLASVEERARAAQIRAAEAKVRARATLLFAAAGIALVLLGGGGWTWMQQQRVERARATDTAVAAALQDATLARGKQEWDAAIAALGSARARVASGESSASLRAQVAALGATIEREADAARSAARLAEENEKLLAALEDVRQPEGSTQYPTDWKALDQTYHDLLAEYGVDVDAVAPKEAARRLAERGIAVELASRIDEWAGVRRQAQEADGAAALTTLADALDPEPMRHELRTALAATDLGSLQRLAKDARMTTLPAPTLWLLAHALAGGRDYGAAIALLEAGRRQHPQDFAIAMELGRALVKTTPSRAGDSVKPYEAALALRPQSVEAWHELGRTLDPLLKRHADALELFLAAVERMPRDGHLRYHLATAYSDLGRKEEALAAAQLAVELDPRDVWVHTGLCKALFDLGRYDEALGSAERAVGLEPRNSHMHIDVASVLIALRRDEEAIASGRRAIEFDPTIAMAHYKVGLALLHLGRYEEAVPVFRRAIELDPGYVWAYCKLGDSLSDLGRHQEAVAIFHRAMKIDPECADVHGGLGVALGRLGRNDEAMACFRRAIELNPKYAKVHFNLGVSLVSAGRLKEAMESYRRAIEFDPTDAEPHEAVGILLANRGSYEEAIASTRRALELDPKRVSSHANLGAYLNRLGRYEEALASHRRALELAPASILVLVNLGISLTNLGRLEEAVSSFRRVLEFDPRHADAAERLANALFVLGRHEEAIAGYRHALELAPGNQELRVQFAFILATVDEEDLRDPGEAIACTRRAIELAGARAAPAIVARNQSVLGIALYVDGEHEEARAALERAVELGGENGSRDARRLFLALCHLHLGHESEARACFEKAAPDFDALLTSNPALKPFVDEARAEFAPEGPR